MVECLEIGVSKYEIGIFLDGQIVEVFRTDSLRDKLVISNEAEKRLEHFKKEYPDRNYKAENIPKGMKVRNVAIFH